MARLPRLSVPGYPQLVLQRGHNGQAIFHDEADRQRMLALLQAQAAAHTVAVHAYALLESELYLLLTPATADGLARLMQAIGRSYVRHFNDRYGRSGTLWEGRYRSALLQPDSHVLSAMVFIDTAALRAGLAAQPAAWRWSSYGHYAGARTERLLTPPQSYWSLGNTPFAREVAYQRRVEEGLEPGLLQALTDAARHGWALGSADFLDAMEKQTRRRLRKGRAGRPRRVLASA
jgi:putative transposase